ncbi:hypothetical protein [Candidatus Uabimicrobium amorphum]|uniref:Uncharacterized protein n=1 Tax=Uabimicrobium amorphum TaxID=2596890 RepID=A0A5S9F4S9_UABAM|nr:hypothetical protein [Candidatus Uabimicrobium amorphum]BBM84552.1 hypothetical protein UABAM_02913 [Candidatus Uabimicrobium amorphum]
MRAILRTISIILLASQITALPLTVNVHKDEGNSTLDGGRHAWSQIKISENGKVEIYELVINKVLLAGYCFKSAYIFVDEKGNTLARYKESQICVDGKWTPLPHKRTRVIFHDLPVEIAKKVRGVKVNWSPGSKDPLKLLEENIKKLINISEASLPSSEALEKIKGIAKLYLLFKKA